MPEGLQGRFSILVATQGSAILPRIRNGFGSIALSILLAVISPLRPFLIQYTVNTYIRGGLNADLSVRERMVQLLIYVTILQIGILLIETLLRFYFSFITAWLGQTVVKDLRVAVYKRVLNLNLSQYDKTPIGTLTTRTINDIEAINDIFSEGLIPIVSDLLSIISILLFMFLTNWQLTLICLIPFNTDRGYLFFKESVNKSFIRVRNAVAALMHLFRNISPECRSFRHLQLRTESITGSEDQPRTS
jgi:ATP-binding cassette subfamily B protein